MARETTLQVRWAVVAVAMAFALVASLSAMVMLAPAQAYAKPTKTVWLLAKAQVINKDDHQNNTLTYTYTKNGLLKNKKNAEKGNEKFAYTYAYKYTGKSVLKSCTVKEGKKLSSKISYSANKKGFVTKSVENSYGEKTVLKYTYDKKGRLHKMAQRNGAYLYKYNKKSQVKSYKWQSEALGTYKYDSKGYPASLETPYDGTASYKNTYKNGLLKKCVYNMSSYNTVVKYTYKKMKVPASLLKMVNAQQFALITGLPSNDDGIVPFEAAHK